MKSIIFAAVILLTLPMGAHANKNDALEAVSSSAPESEEATAPAEQPSEPAANVPVDEPAPAVKADGRAYRYVCEPNYQAMRESSKKEISDMLKELKKDPLRTPEERGFGLFGILDRVSRATFPALEKNVHLVVSYDESQPQGHYRYSKESYVDSDAKPDYSTILLDLPIVKKISKDVNSGKDPAQHIKDAVNGQLNKEFLDYAQKHGIKAKSGTIEGDAATVLASRNDFQRRDAWGANAGKTIKAVMETPYGSLIVGQDLRQSGFDHYRLKCAEQK